MAAYSLKFATVAVIVFLSREIGSSEAVSLLLSTSIIVATMGMGISGDVKKQVANMSILHMAGGLLVFTASVGLKTTFLTNFT